MQIISKNQAKKRKYRIVELLAKRFTDTGESLPEQKRQLAAKLKISYSQLNRIVNAEEDGSPIDSDKLIALSQHFGCTVEEILNDSGHENNN